MTGGKKWLVVITDDQHEWMSDLAESLDIKGTVIVRELLDRAMAEDQRKFRASLSTIKLKAELQSVNDKKAEILEKEKELQKKLKEEGVAA